MPDDKLELTEDRNTELENISAQSQGEMVWVITSDSNGESIRGSIPAVQLISATGTQKIKEVFDSAAKAISSKFGEVKVVEDHLSFEEENGFVYRVLWSDIPEEYYKNIPQEYMDSKTGKPALLAVHKLSAHARPKDAGYLNVSHGQAQADKHHPSDKGQFLEFRDQIYNKNKQSYVHETVMPGSVKTILRTSTGDTNSFAILVKTVHEQGTLNLMGTTVKPAPFVDETYDDLGEPAGTKEAYDVSKDKFIAGRALWVSPVSDEDFDNPEESFTIPEEPKKEYPISRADKLKALKKDLEEELDSNIATIMNPEERKSWTPEQYKTFTKETGLSTSEASELFKIKTVDIPALQEKYKSSKAADKGKGGPSGETSRIRNELINLLDSYNQAIDDVLTRVISIRRINKVDREPPEGPTGEERISRQEKLRSMGFVDIDIPILEFTFDDKTLDEDILEQRIEYIQKSNANRELHTPDPYYLNKDKIDTLSTKTYLENESKRQKGLYDKQKRENPTTLKQKVEKDKLSKTPLYQLMGEGTMFDPVKKQNRIDELNRWVENYSKKLSDGTAPKDKMEEMKSKILEWESEIKNLSSSKSASSRLLDNIKLLIG